MNEDFFFHIVNHAETEQVFNEISAITRKTPDEVREFCKSCPYDPQYILDGVKICGVLDTKAIQVAHIKKLIPYSLFEYMVNMMNEQTLVGLANQAIAQSSYPDPRFPPSPYYRFLEVLARHVQPRLSVELGVCGGGGSLHLALGWPAGLVVGIDVTNDYPDNIKFIEFQFPCFTFLIGDSVEMAQKVYHDFGRTDILFIDTTHVNEQTRREFNAWEPYLARNAIVCFDDLRRPGMNTFWNELPGNKVRLDDLHPSAEGGFGVWWR